MNDRELAKAMRLIAECERRSGTAQPKTIDLLEQGAARLDAMRWRGVEEGLPEIGVRVDAVRVGGGVASGERNGFHSWYLDGWVVSAGAVTHWRYVDPPGAEGGGE